MHEQSSEKLKWLTLNPGLCDQTAPSSAPQIAALSTNPVPTKLSLYESQDIFLNLFRNIYRNVQIKLLFQPTMNKPRCLEMPTV